MLRILFLLLLLPSYSYAQTLELTEPIRFLALGDSYTIGHSVPEAGRWPVQLSDSLTMRGYQVDTTAIIATTGWTTTNLRNAITNQQLESDHYNLVSLLIGVNDQYQGIPIAGYPGRFQALLDSAIRYAGGNANRVFVVSIPDYAYTPFGNGNSTISIQLDAYNAINDSIAAANNVAYFNITPISRQGLNEPVLVASDGLHPSAEQYRRWVSLMLETLGAQPQLVGSIAKRTELTLFPNPSGQAVQLQHGPLPAGSDITVIDASGRMVLKQTASNEATIIPTHQLPAGSYVLRLHQPGKRVEVATLLVGH